MRAGIVLRAKREAGALPRPLKREVGPHGRPSPELLRFTKMPLLFSYGTLQQSNVQLAIFGRELSGTPDSLVGYEQSLLPIDNPEVVRTSAKTHHPIVKYIGDANARVSGTVFEITTQELEHADRYEVSAYKSRGSLGIRAHRMGIR